MQMTTAATVLSPPEDLPDLDAREALCRSIALSAGALARAAFANRGTGWVNMKGPQDFLTETDAAVEAHLKAEIARAFPEDGFLGEEGGGAVSGNVWVVDPIDGTANFARGIPHYCISIAFVSGGETRLGAICNPSMDELYFARQGRGATRNGTPIRVAPTRDYNSACVELGWSLRVPNATYVKVLDDILAQGANVRRGASGALGLAYVADGKSDAYAELHMHPWDCLAGLLLVREAGGIVAPFLEVDGLAKGGAVLAATPGIAEGMSRATGIAV
jgi:myo-inositol-1(or 4)-monophosphatase